jgi:hypothetical protein
MPTEVTTYQLTSETAQSKHPGLNYPKFFPHNQIALWHGGSKRYQY